MASRIATDTAAGVLREEIEATSSRDRDVSAHLSEAMRRSVLRAHQEIRAESERDPELDGMGTTLTALAIDSESDVYALGHVGDSRAYLLRDGELTQLTRDDTWVQERIEANIFTPEQGRRHPFAHLLTQCLGLRDAPSPQIASGIVQAGDVYLLCTDGLVGMIDDEELRKILHGGLGDTDGQESGTRTIQALLDAANAAGGLDNITAALLTIGNR